MLFLTGLETRKQGADVPWGPRVRYTENGVGMTVGDGIWATVTAHTSNPLVVADPANQSLVWLGGIEEHGQPGWFAVRIKAANGRIVEAEAVMRRKEGRPPYADPTSFLPDPAFSAAGGTLSRAALVALPRTILLRAARVRNGVALVDVLAETSRGVAYPAVDAAHGLVALVGMRDHVGDSGDADGEFPHSYAFVTIIKINGDKAAAVEEVQSDTLPYLMPSWSAAAAGK